MNILYISHYSQIGGANNELLLILEEMMRRGNNVSVALPTQDIFCNKLKERRIKYIISGHKNWIIETKASIISRGFKGIAKGLCNIKAVWNLVRYVNTYKIDLIHTNDSLTIVGYIVARICKIPHVWHIREFLDSDYGYKYVYPQFIVKSCYRKAAAVVFISKAIEDKYKNFINYDNTYRIYDAIPSSEVVTVDKFSRFTVLYAGGGMASKGIYEILDAIKILHSQGQKDIKCIIAGDCTEKHEEIEKFIKTNELLDSVDILGFVSNLGELQMRSHVFVTCAKKEAFGLITVEAMQRGAVVIGTNSGGTAEIIEPFVNGYLYSFGNHQELAERILYIKENYAELNMVIEAAKVRANTVFSPMRLGDELSVLYSKCKER